MTTNLKLAPFPFQISFRVRKRFPTLDHLIELGLLTPDELKIMDSLNEKALVKKWWMPLVWATHIVEKARRYWQIQIKMLSMARILPIGSI